MTTAAYRRNAALWIEYLKRSPEHKAHRFELMELVDMSTRTFEGFKKWFLWKYGANMKYSDEFFQYLIDDAEDIKEANDVLKQYREEEIEPQ